MSRLRATGEEGADDRFQPRELCEVGAEEDHRQHEDILGYVVAALFEEPVRQQRKEEQDDADAQQHRGAEPPPEAFIHVACGHADDHREQQQGQRVGDDRAADGDRDGLVARDAELADDGIGYKGLGGEESGKQDRGVDRESHNVITCQNAERERYAEGVESEDETAPAAFFEVGRIHVQSRKKHDVEQAGGPRKDDAAVAQHEVESVRADNRAGDYQPQKIGDLQLVQEQRRRQNDDQNQQKLQDRVFERQCYRCYMGELKHHAIIWLSYKYIKICG